MTPKKQDLEDLKNGASRFLFPRILIGAVLLMIMALYIFWPR